MQPRSTPSPRQKVPRKKSQADGSGFEAVPLTGCCRGLTLSRLSERHPRALGLDERIMPHNIVQAPTFMSVNYGLPSYRSVSSFSPYFEDSRQRLLLRCTRLRFYKHVDAMLRRCLSISPVCMRPPSIIPLAAPRVCTSLDMRSLPNMLSKRSYEDFC